MNTSTSTSHDTLSSSEQEKTRRRRRKSLLGVFAVIGGSIAIILVFGLMKSDPVPKVPEVPPAPAVKSLSVIPETRNIRVNSQGSVTAVRHINLISEVAGRVIAVDANYADGGFFEANKAIVTIDDRDYQLALKQANAELAKTQELLATEKGRARQAKREWRDLGNQEANTLFLREPQLASAQAALLGAEAMRDKVELNLSRTRISAPFTGRIAKKLVDVGQYVTPGTVIAEVYSTESVQIRLPLTDRQIAYIDLPLTATPRHPLPEVNISAIHGGEVFNWTGQIVRTEATLDPKSRVIFAVAEVQAPYSLENTRDKPPLSVGMYVSAEIIGRKIEDLVSLPRSVLRKKSEITLVDDNDEIRFKDVEVLQNIGDEIIVSGLQRGDRVLLTRVPFAVAGLKVKPEANTSQPDTITDQEAMADAPQAASFAPAEASEQ